MDCGTPGFPVHHQLLQLAQTLTRLHYSRSIYYLPNVLNTYFVDYLLSQLEYNLSTGRSYFCFTPPCVWQLCTVPRVCAQSLSRVWLWDPMDCSLPGSSVHGIFSARILEWVAISSSRGSSWPRTEPSACNGRQILYHQCHLGSPT